MSKEFETMYIRELVFCFRTGIGKPYFVGEIKEKLNEYNFSIREFGLTEEEIREIEEYFMVLPFLENFLKSTKSFSKR